MISRRRLLTAATLITGGLALAACGGAGQSSTPPRQTEPVKLIFGRRANAPEQPVIEQYVANYRQVAPNVSVDLTVMPAGLQEMRQGLITAFAGGAGPDLFISD